MTNEINGSYLRQGEPSDRARVRAFRLKDAVQQHTDKETEGNMMRDYDRNRLIRSLDDAMELIEREAFCYCYKDDPEYLGLTELLQAYKRKLQERNGV